MNREHNSKGAQTPANILSNPLMAHLGKPGEQGPNISENAVRHVGFRLSTDEFLLAMKYVREIIMLPRITFLPRTDSAVEGVFAIRGEIMPVVNLRRILQMGEGKREASTRAIILQTERGGLGLIVDDITEFVWVTDASIQLLDQNFFGEKYHFLSGVSKIGTKMCGVLDVEKLIARFPVEQPTVEDIA
jgi:purine-binding chemotaxis protein CheW